MTLLGPDSIILAITVGVSCITVIYIVLRCFGDSLLQLLLWRGAIAQTIDVVSSSRRPLVVGRS